MDILTVRDLTAVIRETIELNPELQGVRVQGEVSNMKRAASGHWYFTLKDDAAQIRCVMWRSNAEKQSVQPQNGDELVALGHVGVYEPRGDYQLYVQSVRPLGLGDLFAQFEHLKAALDAEGLFDPLHRKPLPVFPKRIGVVTSPDAAAFQDVQNVLRRRYPIADVVLSPSLVQGNDAPLQIIAALGHLDATQQMDVILLVRGGGSLEDLWAFNDEGVARAVFAAKTPIISGIGHETDFTIADFVADHRAPTPSAAAEIATPDVTDLREALREQQETLVDVMNNQLKSWRDQLSGASKSLGYLSPSANIDRQRQQVDELHTRLMQGQQRRMALLRERLEARHSALAAASPQAILSRGYARVTRTEDNQPVTQTKDATPGTGIQIHLHDGDLAARIEDRDTHERYKRTLF